MARALAKPLPVGARLTRARLSLSASQAAFTSGVQLFGARSLAARAKTPRRGRHRRRRLTFARDSHAQTRIVDSRLARARARARAERSLKRGDAGEEKHKRKRIMRRRPLRRPRCRRRVGRAAEELRADSAARAPRRRPRRGRRARARRRRARARARPTCPAPGSRAADGAVQPHALAELARWDRERAARSGGVCARWSAQWVRAAGWGRAAHRRRRWCAGRGAPCRRSLDLRLYARYLRSAPGARDRSFAMGACAPPGGGASGCRASR